MATRTVEYQQGGTVLEGVLADSQGGRGPLPGILVVPEWNGIGPNSIKRAEMLAELGYVAFVADVYGKGIRPDNFQDAAKESSKYKDDRPLLRARMMAALDTLRGLPGVDGGKLAAIGYCFGGTAALELARAGAKMAGLVSFHGGLDSPSPADGRNITCKVLALHGADDPIVPPPAVQAFEQEMRDAKVDWQLVAYGGAVHSFTNWNAGANNATGIAYNEKADKRSWVAMRAFFDEIFA